MRSNANRKKKVPRVAKPHLNRRRLDRRQYKGTRSDGCLGKKPYETLDAAKTAATNLLVGRKLRCTYIYLCRVSGHYHVSRSKGVDWLYKVEFEDG